MTRILKILALRKRLVKEPLAVPGSGGGAAGGAPGTPAPMGLLLAMMGVR
jgi:hypothetical protein